MWDLLKGRASSRFKITSGIFVRRIPQKPAITGGKISQAGISAGGKWLDQRGGGSIRL